MVTGWRLEARPELPVRRPPHLMHRLGLSRPTSLSALTKAIYSSPRALLGNSQRSQRAQRQIERCEEVLGGRESVEKVKQDPLLSFFEIQFNQRHLCKGREAFPLSRLKQSLSWWVGGRGVVFEVRGNYHFLPITVPRTEGEQWEKNRKPG